MDPISEPTASMSAQTATENVLARFFGPDAVNARLMLIETASFTTCPAGHAGVDDEDHR